MAGVDGWMRSSFMPVGHSAMGVIHSLGMHELPPKAPQSAPAMAAVLSVSPPASMI
ncbi:MAG: hypothetical protein L3J39_14105 [Verrucomicrobiales bacterium]|nr:hypothetical protein [Verrucomicrobiales bacterium]